MASKIPGARKTKGRTTSGHLDPLEQRTWQESHRLEAMDREMRHNGRLNPPEKPMAQDAPRNLKKGMKRL
jgi:hypothetical protein